MNSHETQPIPSDVQVYINRDDIADIKKTLYENGLCENVTAIRKDLKWMKVIGGWVAFMVASMFASCVVAAIIAIARHMS